MGLFTKKKKEEPKEEEAKTGLSPELTRVVSASLANKLGSNNLDAVLETFAPNTIWEIKSTGDQVCLLLEVSTKLFEKLEVIQKQQNELKESYDKLLAKYDELTQDRQTNAR